MSISCSSARMLRELVEHVLACSLQFIQLFVATCGIGRYKQQRAKAKEDAQWPDEMDTPEHVSARVRFQRHHAHFVTESMVIIIYMVRPYRIMSCVSWHPASYPFRSYSINQVSRTEEFPQFSLGPQRIVASRLCQDFSVLQLWQSSEIGFGDSTCQWCRGENTNMCHSVGETTSVVQVVLNLRVMLLSRW